MTKRYKAFISYSHAADGRLAPAVQHALHRIAKPWYRLRTMHVFRDQTNLATSPGLWTSIESALRQAEFFVYLASPTAAHSPWVQKEVEWWLKNRSPQTFLIVLTDGNIAWDNGKQDIDWELTNAIPRQVDKVFAEEPLYSDIRWARTVDQLSSRHSQFRAAILDLAATLLNRPKDELDGDDVRQYRRTRRIAWSGVVTLTLLFVVALVAAYLATQQSMLATSRALGARSEALLPTNPELALLLARESLRFKADNQAEYALRLAFVRNPQRMIHHTSVGRTVVAKFIGSNFVVAAELDKRAVVWDVATGKRVFELPVDNIYEAEQFNLSDSADHSLVAVPAGEDSFSLYDGNTWKLRVSLPGTEARFSRNGGVITARDGNKLRQWSVPSLQERKVNASLPEKYDVHDISPDGALLLLTENSEISEGLIVQAASGRILARLPRRVFRTGGGFSPDGRLMVTERMDSNDVIELWDTNTGKLVRILEKTDDIGWVTYVTFSPDGKLYVSGNRSGELVVWNVETGKHVLTLRKHRNDIMWIKFSPDSKTMLTASPDGTACLWDTATLRCLVTLGGRGDDAYDLDFASDNRHFLTTHTDGTVRVWDRQVWYPDQTFPADQAVVSDNGHLVLGASKPGLVKLWNADTGKLKKTFENPTGEIERLALHRPASLIAIAPVTGVVALWNADTGQRTMELGAASAKTTALAFNPAGDQLVTGRKDGRVLFWSTSDGRLLSEWQASKETVSDIVVHPDDVRVAVATWDGWSVRDKKSGAIILEAKLDEEGAATEELALNASGDLLLAVGDRFPQVWNLKTRARVQTLSGYTDEVYSGAFSRDGRWLLTGSGYKHARGEAPEDGVAVVVWDVGSGRQVLTYRSALWAVETVSISDDGTKIFAAGGLATVRRYECEVCLPVPALIDLVSSRVGRGLSADERARYVPTSTLLGWMAGH